MLVAPTIARCRTERCSNTQVALQCGEKEHLQHVVEPGKCEYVAQFTTPAACHAENAKRLQQQVLEDEQALHGAHDDL